MMLPFSQVPLSEVHFAEPLFLAMPFVILLLLVLRRQKQPAVMHPDLTTLRAISPGLRLRLRQPCLGLLAVLLVLSLSIAAARPQKISIMDQQVESAALMLAIDASKSMLADDFESNGQGIARLEAVKLVVEEFIDARPDDQIGLAVFGQNAALAAPLTHDHAMLKQMITGLQPGVLGDATAMGDGLGTALRHMQDIKAQSKAIILLTDGVSNAGQVNPIKAAGYASDMQVKIHTIGIGTNEPVDLSGGSFFFKALRGQPEFDEQTLKRIAEMTGGVYFNADSLEGLKQVYARIDELEKIKTERYSAQQIDELFFPFALAALILLLSYLMLSRFVFRKVP